MTTPGWRSDLEERGYTHIPRVFSAAECASIRAAGARIVAVSAGHSFEERFGNVRFFMGAAPDATLRSAIWCALLDPELERLRRDPRLFAYLRPLLGDSVRQVTNQLHFKLPGSRASFPLHSDRSSRDRAQGGEIRNLDRSFYQTAIVAERMGRHNGGVYFLPGSHRWSPGTPYAAHVDARRRPEEDFAGAMPEGCEAIEADEGDLLLWHGDAVHGSAVSHDPTSARLLYLNGYARAEDCLRGYFAWIDVAPVPMPPIGVPVLVYGPPDLDAFRLDEGEALRARVDALRGATTPPSPATSLR